MKRDYDEARISVQVPYPFFRHIATPDGTHPLVRPLIARCNELRMPMSEVCRRAGLDDQTLEKWRKTTNPTVINLEAALNVVGLRLAVAPIDEGKKVSEKP